MQSFIMMGQFRFLAEGDKTTHRNRTFQSIESQVFFFFKQVFRYSVQFWAFLVHLPRNDCLKRPKLRLWPLLLL